MATQQFYENTITDKVRKSLTIDLEFGKSSFYGGESLIYLTVNGVLVILDEAAGRDLYQSMQNLGTYLGYDK